MKEKPISLYTLCIFFFLIALGIPLQVIGIYEFSIEEMDLVLANISFPNWLVIMTATTSGVLVFTSSRFALASIIILTFTLIWNNYYVGLSGFDFGLGVTSVASLGFITFVGTTLSLGGYKALANEKFQWWRTAPRLRAAVPVVLRPLKGQPLKAVTFDISKGGAFIPCNLEGWGELEPGDFLNVHMTFGELKVFRCSAKVVRKTDSSGKYPQGIGIQFDDIAKHDMKVLESEFRNINT